MLGQRDFVHQVPMLPIVPIVHMAPMVPMVPMVPILPIVPRYLYSQKSKKSIREPEASGVPMQ